MEANHATPFKCSTRPSPSSFIQSGRVTFPALKMTNGILLWDNKFIKLGQRKAPNLGAFAPLRNKLITEIGRGGVFFLFFRNIGHERLGGEDHCRD